jgi:hypothetical protein
VPLRRVAILAAITAAGIAVLVTTSGPPGPLPAPPREAFSFAALGDAPYYPWEELRFRTVLADLDQHDLASVIHVGDVFWRPCTDDHYRKALDRLDRLRHPVVFTPGDNEWTDCWEPGSGAFVPLERLERLRQIFFARPPALPGLQRQNGFVENVRWEQGGVVFAAVHVVGSSNGMQDFPGKTPADDQAARARIAAASEWTREAFREAARRNAPAVVIAFHASVSLEQPRGHQWRIPYEPFIEALESETARFGKPVLIVHGDDHEYLVDHPVARLPNLTRLEVPGSPQVGWVRVAVTPGAAQPFACTSRVVPSWKYW